MVLKVVFIACAYKNSGVGDYTYDLIKTLKKTEDLKITLLSGKCYCEKNFGQSLYECNYINPPKIRSDNRLMRGITYSVNSSLEKPDILHYQLCGDYFGIRSLLTLSKFNHSKLIVTIHEIEAGTRKIPKSISHVLWNLAFKNVDKIIVHSQYTRKSLSNFVNENKIVVIPHGAHLGSVYEGERSEITYFGGFDHRKGFNYLLKALKNLKLNYLKNIRLSVYGYYTELEKMRILPLVEKLGLKKNVYFGGLLNKDEFQKKISESLLVVAPYLDSNSSGIVLKTMAYQTPLITTSVGSIPEYVKNSAILVPPRDENKLAEGMLSLLINKNKRENLAIEARQRIEKNYTWNKIAMQTHHLYEQVMLQ